MVLGTALEDPQGLKFTMIIAHKCNLLNIPIIALCRKFVTIDLVKSLAWHNFPIALW